MSWHLIWRSWESFCNPCIFRVAHSLFDRFVVFFCFNASSLSQLKLSWGVEVVESCRVSNNNIVRGWAKWIYECLKHLSDWVMQREENDFDTFFSLHYYSHTRAIRATYNFTQISTFCCHIATYCVVKCLKLQQQCVCREISQLLSYFCCVLQWTKLKCSKAKFCFDPKLILQQFSTRSWHHPE